MKFNVVDKDGRVLFTDNGYQIAFSSDDVRQSFEDAAFMVELMDMLDEIESISLGDGPYKMDTSTNQKLLNGHRILHHWWRVPSATSWTKEQVVREHTRVVRIMFERGMKHHMHDGLDETLPEDLKKKSREIDKEEKRSDEAPATGEGNDDKE